ncbi:hypothetical protein SLEP1_g39722 [Rubroshorea leprosula]|uniref:Uncharacterized protein n=1 Tax=Rubroshorea leprosula TaxID=152421 RepID=A0AAV5L1T8_9ROSI|nr:hypothetical protein SLEP1_g39722 [Rubroshorea leprosula]
MSIDITEMRSAATSGCRISNLAMSPTLFQFPQRSCNVYLTFSFNFPFFLGLYIVDERTLNK